jgi:hypothetical protein
MIWRCWWQLHDKCGSLYEENKSFHTNTIRKAHMDLTVDVSQKKMADYL